MTIPWVLLRYVSHVVIARSAVRHDVAIPFGFRGLTMPWVLLRYAVEGIASSRRRLAPRNDTAGDIKPNGVG